MLGKRDVLEDVTETLFIPGSLDENESKNKEDIFGAIIEESASIKDHVEEDFHSQILKLLKPSQTTDYTNNSCDNSRTETVDFVEDDLWVKKSDESTRRLFSDSRIEFINRKLTYNQIWKNNPEILPFMRASLLDWMMEVGSELALRRETIQNAIIITDWYLSKCHNFPKNKLQLLSLSTMLLASKIEEIYAPTVQNFAFTTNGAYSTKEITMLELQISKKLNWKLHNITHIKILGSISASWDLFIESIGSSCTDEFQFFPNDVCFRKSARRSYELFCMASQILDCFICIDESMDIDPIELVFAIFSFCLLHRCKHSIGIRTALSQFYLKIGIDRVDIQRVIEWIEIQNAIQIKLYLGPPIALKTNSEHVVKDHYEDFLSLQNYSQGISLFLKERYFSQS